MNDAEDSAIRSDAQRKRDRRHDGEPRVPEQQSPRITPVLPHAAHHATSGFVQYELGRARSSDPVQFFDQRLCVRQFVEGTIACFIFRGTFGQGLPIPVCEVMDELSDDLLSVCGITRDIADNTSHVEAPIRHVRGS